MHQLCVQRRSLIVMLVGISSTGCLRRDYSPGDLIIKNNSPQNANFQVTVQRYETEDETYPNRGETPDPSVSPIWENTEQCHLQPDDQVHIPGFVTEVGLYYVSAEVNGAEFSHMWVDFYQTAEGIGEDEIYVTLTEQGHLSVFASHGD